MQLNIGIDDTDSKKGGCTTYIAARLVEKFAKLGIPFIDYPNIIRLNPNIPFKTRGNAAVALRLDIQEEICNTIQETVLQEIEQNSDLGRKDIDPAVVFLKGKPTSRINQLSCRALWDIVPEDEAVRVLRLSRAAAAAYGEKLGLVGALAAVGQTLNGDHTFELIAYREKQNYGSPRRVDEDSLKRMDRLTAPKTFNNYDYENMRMLITPHGPDPVLLGVRGESPQAVLRAFRLLTVREPIERWVIFRTNHGTDAHLLPHTAAGRNLKPNTSTVLKGIVGDKPKRIRGGHVFFTLVYKGRTVRCAAFEPTGKFREIVAKLLPGDWVTVFGGVQAHSSGFPLTINLEKIRLHRLTDKLHLENPTCPRCCKHMKSAGKGQGFRCEKCSIIIRKVMKRTISEQRALHPGLYVPTLKAHRHLTKPLCRYGQEKEAWNRRPPSGEWHVP